MKNFKLFDIEQAQSEVKSQPEPAPLSEEYSQAPASQNNTARSIYNPIAEQKEAEARYREVYSAYQEAIRRSEGLRAEITKGILQGEAVYNLLLKAIECISLMTGETLFYNQNREQIKAIYGVGLLETVPLEIELDEVRRRLAMLTRPELEKEPSESRERIRQAVKRHRERETQLIELLRLNSQ